MSNEDDAISHLGTDTLPPERYLGPKVYRVTCRCEVCLEEFSWTTEKLSKKNRACPNPVCVAMRREAQQAKIERNMARVFEERRGPATIGDKPMVKAVDMTADIVMEDYGLTNLQDNIRAGDMVAPKLPAPQQRMADGFFGGKAMQEANGKSAGSRQAELIRARALSGRYRGMAINPGVASFGRPEGQSPLQAVRTEPIQKPR